MTRVGDLLQHNRMITDGAERKEAESLARDMGAVLEQIALVTGGVGNIYKSIEMPENARLKVSKSDTPAMFEPLYKRCFDGNQKEEQKPAPAQAPAQKQAEPKPVPA